MTLIQESIECCEQYEMLTKRVREKNNRYE